MPLLKQNLNGLKLYMYYNDVKQHHIPHFHAIYGDYSAVVDFSGNIIEGFLPAKFISKLKNFGMEYQDELAEAWKLAVNGKPFRRI